MRFGDLRRLALDIEVITTEGFEFPNAAREGDRIVAIALADTTGFRHVVRGDRMDERAVLEECGRIIAERDPDVIEGHNIFRFDLEYIEARARRHGLVLGWGRDGSPLRGRPSRLSIAERSVGFRRYELAGRHIVDTWMLALLHDAGTRDLPSLGLEGHRAPSRRRRRRPHVRGGGADLAHVRRVAGRAHGLRRGRRGGDARRRRVLRAAVLRAGAVPAVRLPVRHAARRRREDRRAAAARVPAPRRAVPAPRPPSVGRRRLHRGLPARRGAPGPARRRHLALSVADARAARSRRRATRSASSPPSSRHLRDVRVEAKRASRAAGDAGGAHVTPARSSSRSRSSSTRSTATSPSAPATGTTSKPPTASPRKAARW